jgi:hypothetical protein
MRHIPLSIFYFKKLHFSFFSLRILPCACVVRGHCMCQGSAGHEVDRVVDKKRIIGKMEGRGGGEAQGADDPKENPPFVTTLISFA